MTIETEPQARPDDEAEKGQDEVGGDSEREERGDGEGETSDVITDGEGCQVDNDSDGEGVQVD